MWQSSAASSEQTAQDEVSLGRGARARADAPRQEERQHSGCRRCEHRSRRARREEIPRGLTPRGQYSGRVSDGLTHRLDRSDLVPRVEAEDAPIVEELDLAAERDQTRHQRERAQREWYAGRTRRVQDETAPP